MGMVDDELISIDLLQFQGLQHLHFGYGSGSCYKRGSDYGFCGVTDFVVMGELKSMYGLVHGEERRKMREQAGIVDTEFP